MWQLTFAGADVVEVQLVALLGSLQGALGGKEVAGGLVGLVVSSANLQERKQSSVCNAVTLHWQTSPHTCASDQTSPLVWKYDFPDFLSHGCTFETNWTKSSEFFFFFYSLLCVMSQTPDSPNREAPPTGSSSALLAAQSDYSWPNAKILLSACREDKSSSCRNTQSCTASAPATAASHTSLRSGTLGRILNSHAQSLLPLVGRWRGPGTHTWECCSHPPHTLCPSCSGSSDRHLWSERAEVSFKGQNVVFI